MALETTRANTPVSIPMPALILGALSVAPFAVLGAEVITARKIVFGPGPALYALQIFGAVGLSFLAGAQWGRTLSAGGGGEWLRTAVAALLSAAAWTGLWLTGAKGLWVLTAGFLVAGALDVWAPPSAQPAWYARLRLMLTAAVVPMLAAVAWFGPF